VAGGKTADVQGHAGKPGDLRFLPLGEKSIGNAALVEHLDCACVETARA
jgi:hypothetical protein